MPERHAPTLLETALRHDRGVMLIVLVAIPLVGAFVLLYVPFLRDLEPRTRNGFLLAGFLYLCGTLGMEMVGGVWADDRSFIDPVYLNVIVPIEEVFADDHPG